MLTRKQKDFLQQLTALVQERGYFPTVREIGSATGLSSPATVQSYLNRLREKGFLERRHRGWSLVSSPLSVPLMGVVPAGDPLDVFEPLGEEVELPAWMADRSGQALAFRVQGESMRDAYIRDGDVVIVRRADTAEPGAMVVALLDGSAITLKRLRKHRNGAFYLMPENPEFDPIEGPFQVAGLVIGVLRRY